MDKIVFTPREREVVELLAQGKSDREIAEKLYLSIRTVNVHAIQIRKTFRLPNLRRQLRDCCSGFLEEERKEVDALLKE